MLLALLAGLTLSSCRTTGGGAEGLLRARFAIESPARNEYSALVKMPLSEVEIAVQPEAVISEFDYLSVEPVKLELGTCLFFRLKPAAARDFYGITVANQGKRLVLLINGKPVGARRIEAPIADGRIHIFVEAPDEAVEELGEQLRKTNVEIQKKLSR